MAFTWKDSYSVGVSIIDEQHKELISRINQLLEAMMKGSATHEVGKLMDFLAEYVVKHFGMEEQYMRQYGYPEYQAHLAEHKAFVEDFTRLKQDLGSHAVAAYPLLQVQRRVCDWTINHIGKTDTKLAAFLSTKL